MMHFEYRPLNDSEFRLIEFEKIQPDQSIHFKIHHASLASPPEYVALSYTWGKPSAEMSDEWSDPTVTKNVFANGLEFPVRLNLETALRRFQSELSTAGLLFWVDAICINQEDTAERNHQVTLMGEVYGKAVRTVVWLGPGVNDSDHGLAILWKLYDVWNKRPAPLRDRPTPSSRDPPETIELYRLHMLAEEAILNSEDNVALPSPYTTEALFHLLNRHWWDRAWVWQEVLLSRQTFVYCGSSEPLDWNIVTAVTRMAASIIDSSYIFARESFPDIVAKITCEKLLRTLPTDLSIPFAQLSSPCSIRRMVSVLQSRDATDPRDKVYAGSGLLVNSREVDVDYNITIKDLYTSITKLCIERERNLNMLMLCVPEQDESLPSWVPDLSISRASSPRTLSEVSGLEYAAGTSLTFDPRFQEKDLVVKAAVLCIVSYVRHIHHPNVGKEKTFEEALENNWLSTWLTGFVAPHQTPPLLTCLRNGDAFQYKLTNETVYDAYLTTLAGGNQMPDEDPTSPEFIRIICNVVSGRSFFASDLGIIGLGPRNAQVGDYVYMVAGVETPLLLRPRKDGKWTFVGECYTHGVMYGEALGWSEAGNSNVEHIMAEIMIAQRKIVGGSWSR